MIVDFKEIPAANSSDGNQDQFELFARDFVAALGFAILEHPDRGQDGGRDILLREHLTGIRMSGTRKWLLSAKHNAHSGRSVGSEETNIRDRVEKFAADGFLGFYSTLPSSGLANTFDGLKQKMSIDHFDRGLIQQELITNPALESVFRAYFPLSYLRFKSLGGYPATSKDLQTTLTGGDTFPLITFSDGYHVLPNIEAIGSFTLYDLDVSIPSAPAHKMANFSRQTWPFLHPGTKVCGEGLDRVLLFQSDQIVSEIAARNGRFLQISYFSRHTSPSNHQRSLIVQTFTQIYHQIHNSQEKRLTYSNKTSSSDETGEVWVESALEPIKELT
jgi:hypothetical protein